MIPSTKQYKPYCVCKLLTDEHLGLIDYCDSNYSNCNTEAFIAQLRTNNDKISLLRFTEMLILDSLCLNIDRHDKNYAIEVDTDTLRYKHVSQAYDFDCSFGTLQLLNGNSYEELYNLLMRIGAKTSYRNFNNQALAVMTRSIWNDSVITAALWQRPCSYPLIIVL